MSPPAVWPGHLLVVEAVLMEEIYCYLLSAGGVCVSAGGVGVAAQKRSLSLSHSAASSYLLWSVNRAVLCSAIMWVLQPC